MSTLQPQSCSNTGSRASLEDRYRNVRAFSMSIAEPLSAEDCAVQTMPDVSPTRWHLAHTTWFFETFLLKHSAQYKPFDASFEYLFNSYYNTLGEAFPRHRRGQVSRPGLAETMEYRCYVDEQIYELLDSDDLTLNQKDILELGLNHEQQHQELMLTDIKHVLFCNPLYPAYRKPRRTAGNVRERELSWASFPERLVEVGHDGGGFAFDNETPRHKTFLQPHRIATRCVTNREFLAFVEDDGYARPDLWLSLGWAEVQKENWRTPLYWIQDNGSRHEFTLEGLRTLRMNEPVCHVSYFEADAYARWAGYRLPTEFEWEAYAEGMPREGVFSDLLIAADVPIHPQRESELSTSDESLSVLGNIWEWTSSAYSPYPGFRPAGGALGEYNGKFMCNQFVLRGGSCATSSGHIRSTYRNFFPPNARWQFAGIRLAESFGLES